MYPTRLIGVLFTFCVIVLLIAGCDSVTPAVIENTQAPTEAPLEESAVATTEVPAEPTPTPTEAPLEALPPEPQAVSFTNSAGTALSGYYYPAAVNPAPLVVLMHWTNGDMSDWYEVAVWLQNRGQVNPFTNPVEEYWWDESWFPAIPVDKSYGVFIFSFSESMPFPHDPNLEINTTGWLDDAQSAMLNALELEGVDPAQIVTLGSSQGADAAMEGCLYLNEKDLGNCKGALVLSPIGYVGRGIIESIDALAKTSPATPIWYVCNEYEQPPADTLAAIETDSLDLNVMPGFENSGTMFIRDGLNPLPMQLILVFLDEVIP